MLDPKVVLRVIENFQNNQNVDKKVKNNQSDE
jgi:hypothetical protein